MEREWDHVFAEPQTTRETYGPTRDEVWMTEAEIEAVAEEFLREYGAECSDSEAWNAFLRGWKQEENDAAPE